LEAIESLLTNIQNAVGGLPCCKTVAEMRALEDQMRGCGRELARLGSPTDRLQPVNVLVQQACAKYDKAAECFATAATIGTPVAGTDGERTFNEALDCGFSAPNEGSSLLADAVAKGFQIKDAAR